MTPAQWYQLLFNNAQGWVNIFAVQPDGKKTSRWAQNADQFSEIIELGDFRDTWFGCATRYENLGNARGKDDECWEIPGMWVDIDIEGPTHKHDNLPPDQNAALQLVKDYPLKPSIILHSGGGLQAWWLFDELYEASEVTDLLARWAATWQELGARHGWHVDNVFDIARILRVPGTQNHKTDPPNPVTVIHQADARYTVEDLLEYTQDLPEPFLPPAEIAQQLYDGPERTGDRYNAQTDPGQILTRHGCILDTTNRDGSRNYRAPHHAGEPGMTGITVFPDQKTIIYSETFASQTGLQIFADGGKRRLYDAFGLYAWLDHHGDFTAAREALEPSGSLSDLIGTAATLAPGTALQVVELEEARIDSKIVRGGTFIFDGDIEMDIRWGEGADVLWATGETLMIVGPPGVGKTTVSHQTVAAMLGLQPEVLGYPVKESKKVLYLAMDRPQQIKRAFRRLFRDELQRDMLDERLAIQNGPMLYDLAKRPDLIVELADIVGADVVVIDSLKDAALKLSDDEAAGNVNRAFQMCNAENLDVQVLHHQRKGQDGAKPTTLADVYGNTWLTAGTGSVILLWGEAGSELVELSHLKQPVDTVGPLKVKHDHIHGISIVEEQFDMMAFFRNRNGGGATVPEIAQGEFKQGASRAEYQRTDRRVRRWVENKMLRVEPAVKGGEPNVYYLNPEKISVVSAKSGERGQNGETTHHESGEYTPETIPDQGFRDVSNPMSSPVSSHPAIEPIQPWEEPF